MQLVRLVCFIVVGTLFPVVASAVDFATRCQDPNVVKCVDFDQTSDLGGTWGDNFGTLPGDATPEIDNAITASGAGSLKMTIPSNSSANSSGSYFVNFSDDLSVQFDGGDSYYIQWRQRFSPEFLDTIYDIENNGSGGWKHVIISTGDKPGCTTSNLENCYTSCTELELVVQNTSQTGFAQMYNSCTGSTSHGAFDPFNENFGAFDFKLQNARPAPYCLYSQRDTDYFPPQGNCLGYEPNQWMTFQVEVNLGTRIGDEFVDSYVKLWVANEGQPSELVVDWGPYNLTAGDISERQQYGKIWLLPYHTGKSPAQAHPTGYTWYDELIVSRARIADPDSDGRTIPRPPVVADP